MSRGFIVRLSRCSFTASKPETLGILVCSYYRHSPHISSFALNVLKTWSQNAPYLAPFQGREGPLLALDDMEEYPPRAPRKWMCWRRKSHARSNGPQTTTWWVAGCLERREHTRYGIRALVDFEWMDGAVVRRGQGITRDISSKGMFIYSEFELLEKADVLVDVSFRDVDPRSTNLLMRAKGLVIRVEPAAEPGSQQGFAILNRSYELHDGINAVLN